MSDIEPLPDPPPSRVCDECGEPMQHLADLGRFGDHPGKRIFRCYHCNHAVSEPT